MSKLMQKDYKGTLSQETLKGFSFLSSSWVAQSHYIEV